MKISGIAAAGALLFALSGTVQAITLGPGDMDADGVSLSLSDLFCTPGCIPADGSADFELFYASGRHGDSGSFAGSYSTTYWPQYEWDHAEITFGSGPAIDCGGVCWLVVKSRWSTTPVLYFYELSEHGDRPAWNGIEEITMAGFWSLIEPCINA